MIKLHNINPEILVTKSVAVVGNSDILLKKDYGKEIDRFVDVIRFNFGDTLDRHTGKKTTIRWINCDVTRPNITEHKPTLRFQNDIDNYVKQICMKSKIICWDKVGDQLKKYDPKLVYSVPNEFCAFGYINSFLRSVGVNTRFDIKQNSWPRTGFHCVVTLIKSGIKPYLYGFDTESRNVIRHYSLNNRYYPKKLRFHQVDKEVKILTELEKMGLVVIKR